MSTPSPVIEQSIQREKVHSKNVPGRGNGLFASRDVPLKSQVLFVSNPLILALETSRLPDTCYQCLRSSDPATVSTLSTEQHDVHLKSCIGCHVVKFCGKACQTQAWSRYHKWECKLYAKLHPRILPATVRAVVRLLKQHQAGVLPDGEFEQLLELESHQDELAAAGGQRWQNLLLMVMAIKTYSGTEQGMGVLLRICCVLMLNSFTLATSTFDPIGIVLHPLPALINHSCKPNAVVRFDIPTSSPPSPSSQTDSTLPRYGSISIHALQPIAKDDELTISYIDGTFPFSVRQTDLKDRYFFTCTCPLCMEGLDAVSEKFLSLHEISSTPAELSALQVAAEATFKDTQSKPGAEASQLPHLRSVLQSLATTQVWPLTRYPRPQLRQQLVLALLATQRFPEALLHSAILVRLVDPEMFEPHHPVRVVHAWTLWRLCRHCAEGTGGVERQEEAEILAIIGFGLLEALIGVLEEGGEARGELERMVRQAHESAKVDFGTVLRGSKQERDARSHRAWNWLDVRTQKLLADEGAGDSGVRDLT